MFIFITVNNTRSIFSTDVSDVYGCGLRLCAVYSVSGVVSIRESVLWSVCALGRRVVWSVCALMYTWWIEIDDAKETDRKRWGQWDTATERA